MNKTSNVRNKEQIKKRMQVGDLLTAAKMLGITTDAARMRLNRQQHEIIEALEKVIQTREELIKSQNHEK